MSANLELLSIMLPDLNKYYDFDLRATHTLLPTHWLLCHIGFYWFEFELAINVNDKLI